MGVACVSPLTPHPKLNQLPLRKIWLIIIIIFLDLSKNDLERFNDKTTNSGTTSLEENFGGRNLGGSGGGEEVVLWQCWGEYHLGLEGDDILPTYKGKSDPDTTYKNLSIYVKQIKNILIWRN